MFDGAIYKEVGKTVGGCEQGNIKSSLRHVIFELSMRHPIEELSKKCYL